MFNFEKLEKKLSPSSVFANFVPANNTPVLSVNQNAYVLKQAPIMGMTYSNNVFRCVVVGYYAPKNIFESFRVK